MRVITSDKENLSSVLSAHYTPICHIKRGEKFIIETPAPSITLDYINSVNNRNIIPKRTLFVVGPIFVDGIRKGDTVKVNIHRIELQECGYSWFGSWIGVLKSSIERAYIHEWKIQGNEAIFDERIRVPVKKMIGTIGVAPEEEVSAIIPGEYGGNMDIPSLTVGSQLYLRANADGALLYVGDVHALMGEGETLGTGVEIGSRICLSIDKSVEYSVSYPLHARDDFFEIAVSNADFYRAVREVTAYAVEFLMDTLNCDFNKAYVAVGELCALKISQVVNMSCTAVIKIPRNILP